MRGVAHRWCQDYGSRHGLLCCSSLLFERSSQVTFYEAMPSYCHSRQVRHPKRQTALSPIIGKPGCNSGTPLMIMKTVKALQVHLLWCSTEFKATSLVLLIGRTLRSCFTSNIFLPSHYRARIRSLAFSKESSCLSFLTVNYFHLFTRLHSDIKTWWPMQNFVNDTLVQIKLQHT